MWWLANRIGYDRFLRSEVVLPEEQFFPDPYHGTEECVRKLLDRVCGFMDVASDRVALELVEETANENANGFWIPEDDGGCTIQISTSLLDDIQALVATIAHELGHQLLLGGGHISTDAKDLQNVTDLLVAYLGLGLFPANSAFKSAAWFDQGWEYRQIQKRGYLPSRMLVWAMALHCWMRDEVNPQWLGHLNTDPRGELKTGLKYLSRTGDSWFHPSTAQESMNDVSIDRLLDELKQGSDSRQLNAMWNLADHKRAVEAIEPLRRHLSDTRPFIREHACATLHAIGEWPDDLLEEFVSLLHDSASGVRIQAAQCLAQSGQVSDAVLDELGRMLGDEKQQVVDAVATALGRIGPSAQPVVPRLLGAVKKSVVHCADQSSLHLMTVLMQITDAPEKAIRDYYGDHTDDELRIRTLKEFENVRDAQNA